MLAFAMYSRNVRMPASCTWATTVQVVDGLDVLALCADEGSETGTPKRAVRLFSSRARRPAMRRSAVQHAKMGTSGLAMATV